MAYAIGTILEFDRTNACAAAALFGEDALESRYSHFPTDSQWIKAFDPSADGWRMVLDNKAKVDLFVPQIGDSGYAEDEYGSLKHGDFRPSPIFNNLMMLFNTPSNMIRFCLYKEDVQPVIEKRNGKLFPSPQVVKP